jgi:hypothetical protein
MSVLRMRIVAGAAALAALVLSVSTASACCGCGGCGYQPTYYAPVTVYRPVTVYAPVQPTYAVDQGPVYQAPAPVAPEPVPEYVYPRRGYGYGMRHYHRGGWYHRAAYRGRFGGWGGYRGMHHRY